MAEAIYRPRLSVWAAALAILALSAPWTLDHLITTYTTTNPMIWWYHPKSFVANLFYHSSPNSSSSKQGEKPTTAPFVCDPNHTYTTTIISLDPLLLYLPTFLAPAETAALLAVGAPAFAPSHVYKHGRRMGTPDRTSQSAGLPRDDPAVRCVLARAQSLLGPALFNAARDDIGPPQLVRYEGEGQRFNMDAWRGRGWNRVASFFAILEDECEGGETWFPHIEPPTVRSSPASEGEDEKAIWRVHEDGGVAFRPVAGNALFWVNLHANGTGDRRTLHAGLPVDDGLKTAMNIWPRKYYK
ncbi:hypothetical protein PG997_001020 [Apiospora hydei]|uniref:Prolyl 4-hydroxylase alpha subunit domain-containing protein n=1 Tax=Apiospora hydei TaxID=1337664 RepID=A0ABR1XCH0_9PEZI